MLWCTDMESEINEIKLNKKWFLRGCSSGISITL